MLSLLLWALVEAVKAARGAEGDTALQLRAAVVMVLLVALHSQLEYPLWYAYFLLPASFAFGLLVAGWASGRTEQSGRACAQGSQAAKAAKATSVPLRLPPPRRSAHVP